MMITKKRINIQLDVVTLNNNRYISYECKYTQSPISKFVINEEEYQTKLANLGIYKLRFISKAGFDNNIDINKYNCFDSKNIYF